jgi:hypothetical protein
LFIFLFFFNPQPYLAPIDSPLQSRSASILFENQDFTQPALDQPLHRKISAVEGDVQSLNNLHLASTDSPSKVDQWASRIYF